MPARIPGAMSYARPAVTSILRRYPDDIDDCLQDAAVKALRHLGQFRGDYGATFETWFTQIAIREALMHLRRWRETSAALLVTLEGLELPAPSPWPDALAIEAERRRILLAAINGLGTAKRRREAYRMLAGEACGGNTAKARRFKVRERLREMLPGMGIEGAT